MRALFSRIWGGLVHLDDCDPIQPLDDPDETPEPAPAPVRETTPDSVPAAVERLDVPPERRPWDMQARVQTPPMRPMPADREKACIDEQSDRRCDGADALTSQITALKALERRVAELERQVAAMHLKGRTS